MIKNKIKVNFYKTFENYYLLYCHELIPRIKYLSSGYQYLAETIYRYHSRIMQLRVMAIELALMMPNKVIFFEK